MFNHILRPLVLGIYIQHKHKIYKIIIPKLK